MRNEDLFGMDTSLVFLWIFGSGQLQIFDGGHLQLMEHHVQLGHSKNSHCTNGNQASHSYLTDVNVILSLIQVDSLIQAAVNMCIAVIG